MWYDPARYELSRGEVIEAVLVQFKVDVYEVESWEEVGLRGLRRCSRGGCCGLWIGRTVRAGGESRGGSDARSCSCPPVVYELWLSWPGWELRWWVSSVVVLL